MVALACIGQNTLGPLSSVISSIKVRNPNVHVIIMQKERRPNEVSELVEEIKLKAAQQQDGEQEIAVHVRDVAHDIEPDMKLKLVEC